MSVQVRRRRESAPFLSTFVGAQGELIVDTTNNRVQVHDGTTPGGSAAAKLSEVVTNTRTGVADAAYTALVTDRAIAITSLTAARAITLPAASAYPTGTQLLVFDESGNCSSSNTITISRAGTDTINGASSASIATAYGYLAFESNGAGRWTIVDQTASAASAAATRTPVADTSYTALTSDRVIAYTSISAARTVTLPAASAFPVGTQLRILDESGAVSSSNTITMARAGTDTINGATSAIIASAYGYLAIQGNGVGKWTITDQLGGTSLATNSVTNAYLAQMGALTVKANITGSLSTPVDSTLSAIIDASQGSTRGALLYRGAGGWTALAPGSTGTVLTSGGTGADPSYQVAGGATSVPVRQTVMSGPASSGAPSFLPATSASLTLTAQNLSSGTPLTLSAAQGYGAAGATNYVYQFTSNPSWTVTANTTSYLAANAQTGATSVSTMQPIYQFGGAISTANGQFTFDCQAMIGYLGNGTAAVATPLVFVGEAVAGASTITNAIAYAYGGLYDSGWIATLPSVNTLTTKSHNLGVPPDVVSKAEFIIQNTTADVGYSVGDTIYRISCSNGTFFITLAPIVSRLSVSVMSASGFGALNKTTEATGGLTNANWKWKFIVGRGW